MSAKQQCVAPIECYPRSNRVSMMKLLLDNSTYAQTAKSQLIQILSDLVILGHINGRIDVFIHFLSEVLRVVKDRLMRDHGMTRYSTGKPAQPDNI